jgi:CxxC motif-containing protein
MIREKYLTCIACPRGCRVYLEYADDGKIITMEGHRCKKGEVWLGQEIACPMRTLTTTVRTSFPDFPRLPVRTFGDIPLEAFPGVMKRIDSLLVKTRLSCGDQVEKEIYPGKEDSKENGKEGEQIGAVALIATASMSLEGEYNG